MRHLERTHGISIQWTHEIFQHDLIFLAYEITAKMCADIHTKAFKDYMTWKRACMLINILSYEEMSSDDVWSIINLPMIHPLDWNNFTSIGTSLYLHSLTERLQSYLLIFLFLA